MSEHKFNLNQKVESLDSQGWTEGIVTKICLHIGKEPTYMLYSCWHNESNVREVPDTVTVEIPRDLAEWYYADELRGNMHLGKPPNTLMREASRKALNLP